MSNVPYSPTEQALLDLLLAARAPLDVHQLIDLYYRGGREKPWHADIVIRKAINELMKKSRVNREKFIIQRVGGRPAAFRVSRTMSDKSLKKQAK